MSRKVVLNITEEGRGGGAIGRMLIVAKAIEDEYETIIVYPRDGVEFAKKVVAEGVPKEGILLHPLTRDPVGAMKYLLFFFYEVWLLVRLIKKYKPSLIQTNGCWQIKGVIAARLTKTKSFWYMNDSYQPKIILRLFKLFSWLPFSYGFAAHRSKQYYQSVSPRIKDKPSFVISAPVRVDDIKFEKRQRSEHIKILTIGYINANKGISLLVDVAEILKDKSIVFHIVGPVLDSQKGYKRSLDKLIKKKGLTNVEFLGYQKINQELLSSYDLYLCSSLREASPMAVWEALAAGLPVVSTDVGDVKTVLDLYGSGFISDDFTGLALSKKIMEVITLSDQDYHLMSVNGRKTCVEYFAIKEVAKGYLSCYSSIDHETIK